MARRPFPIDPVLTAIAIGYSNPSHTLIADRVLPGVEVMGEEFKWNSYPLAEHFTVPDTRVSRKGQPNQVQFTAEEHAATIEDHGLDDPIPNSDIMAAERARAENRSNFDPKQAATAGLKNLINLGREVRAANIVQDPANYAAGRKITLAGNDQFSDYANSDPYEVIDNGFDSTLVYRPNTIAMGQPAWSAIKRHPKLLNAVKGGLVTEGAITKAQFAELFEIEFENLLIGEAYLNTAKKGQDPQMNRVWGGNIALLYLDKNKMSANDSTITWGFTAELGGPVSGAIDDPDIGLQGGERVRVGERKRELVCAEDVGYLISEAV